MTGAMNYENGLGPCQNFGDDTNLGARLINDGAAGKIREQILPFAKRHRASNHLYGGATQRVGGVAVGHPFESEEDGAATGPGRFDSMGNPADKDGIDVKKHGRAGSVQVNPHFATQAMRPRHISNFEPIHGLIFDDFQNRTRVLFGGRCNNERTQCSNCATLPPDNFT